MAAIDWARLWRPEHHPLETLLRASVAYLFVHVSLRVVGRKELGRHSTYEVVLLLMVSVALRQTIVGSDQSLTTGMLGFGTLLVIDALVAWTVGRSPRTALLVDGSVRELVRDGQLDPEAMQRARVSRDQLFAALRTHGYERLEDVHRAYLERSGHISVIPRRGRACLRPRRRGTPAGARSH
jgi:uncharacterized membrane protein YcaP (DUF421 family)